MKKEKKEKINANERDKRADARKKMKKEKKREN